MTALVERTNENVAVRLRYATCSDVGRRREENQDSYGVFDQGADSLFVVADGMGGVRGGAIASQLAIKIFSEMTAGKSSYSTDDLVAMATRANFEIYEHGIKNPDYAGMGTTAVGLCFHKDQLFVMNVGDSRAYRIRGQEIEQLTDDHTLVSELIKAGTLSEEQRENHPVSHMLTRSLGPTPTVEVDCWPTESPPQIGDKYLICSDGLYNMVKSPQLQYIVSNYNANDAARFLVDTANKNGGTDNITCIVIEVLSALSDAEDATNSGLNSFSTVGTLEFSEPLDFSEVNSEDDTLVEEDLESSNKEESDFELSKEPEQPVFENKIDISDIASAAHESRKEYVKEDRSIVGRNGYLMFSALCLLIGLIYGEKLSHSWGVDRARPRVIAVANKEEFLPPTVPPTPTATPVEEETAANLVFEEKSEEEVDAPLEPSYNTPDYAKIAEDKVLIREKISKLNRMLLSLEKPITGAAVSLLNKDRRRVHEIDKTLQLIKQQRDELEDEKEEWLSRRNRMKRETVQRMATELSRYSGDVDEAWAGYLSFSHKYIKAKNNAEQSDDEATQKEFKLIEQQMPIKLNEVGKVVKKVIKQKIKNVDDRIQALISRKIELEDEKKSKKLSIDLTKAILSGDSEERSIIRQQLEQDLADLESELDGLLQLLPDADLSFEDENYFSEEIPEVSSEETPGITLEE